MSDAYLKKLKDPRWQKKRLEVMEKAGFTCKTCQSKDKTLTVHHINYRKGADPWEYHEDELACLCEECHDDIETRIIPLLRMIAVQANPRTMTNIALVLSRSASGMEDDECRVNGRPGANSIAVLRGALQLAKTALIESAVRSLYHPKEESASECLTVTLEDAIP
jgi:hypothetical protein